MEKRKWHSAKYYTHLRSPEWARIKAEKLHEAQGYCQRCGEQKKLEIHHLHYDTLGNENMNDLLAVCRKCHLELELEKETNNFSPGFSPPYEPPVFGFNPTQDHTNRNNFVFAGIFTFVIVCVLIGIINIQTASTGTPSKPASEPALEESLPPPIGCNTDKTCFVNALTDCNRASFVIGVKKESWVTGWTMMHDKWCHVDGLFDLNGEQVCRAIFISTCPDGVNCNSCRHDLVCYYKLGKITPFRCDYTGTQDCFGAKGTILFEE